MNPRINKLLDFGERVGWTFLQAAAGAAITALTDPHVDWNTAIRFVLITGALAALKVIAAQNFGSSNDGALPSAIKPPPEA